LLRLLSPPRVDATTAMDIWWTA
jgi:hypothetical protein